MKTATNPAITETQLRRSGFTQDQIARFKELRSIYPLIELVRSRRELNELAFVRWRYHQGQLSS